MPAPAATVCFPPSALPLQNDARQRDHYRYRRLRRRGQPDRRCEDQRTKVETSGQTAHAAYASSAGIINSTDTDYVTHGDGAYGAYSRAAFADRFNRRQRHYRVPGPGLVAGSGGLLNASDVQVNTSGDQSYAVMVADKGSELTMTGGNVTDRDESRRPRVPAASSVPAAYG